MFSFEDEKVDIELTEEEAEELLKDLPIILRELGCEKKESI